VMDCNSFKPVHPSWQLLICMSRQILFRHSSTRLTLKKFGVRYVQGYTTERPDSLLAKPETGPFKSRKVRQAEGFAFVSSRSKQQPNKQISEREEVADFSDLFSDEPDFVKFEEGENFGEYDESVEIASDEEDFDDFEAEGEDGETEELEAGHSRSHNIFDNSYSEEALNRFRLKAKFKSEAQRLAGHHHDVFQINPTLADSIQAILKENDWPKAFGKERKNFRFAERIFSSASCTYDRFHTLQYIANEFPLALSCTYRILRELSHRIPKFKPTSMVDFGSGPGTTFWAAREVWDSLNLVVNVEHSPNMVEFGKELLGDISSPSVQFVTKLNHNVIRYRTKPLVTACFVLSEIAEVEEREKLIDQLWATTSDVLILMEAGSMDGFNIIHDARAHILRKCGPHTDTPQAYTVAPCSHDGSCPLTAKNKCTFSSRVFRHGLPPRSSLAYDKDRSHNTAKASRLPNETWMDFAYVVLRKGESPRLQPSESKPHVLFTRDEAVQDSYTWPRIVGPPKRAKDEVNLRVCRSREQGVPLDQLDDHLLQRYGSFDTPKIHPSTGLPQVARIDTWKLKKEVTRVDGSYRQAKKTKKGDLWQWNDVRFIVNQKKQHEKMFQGEHQREIRSKLSDLKRLIRKEQNRNENES